MARVVQDFGSLDVMVNNAGTRSPNHLIGEMPVEEWSRVMDINTNGTFYGIKFACAQMGKQEKGGAICNISSIAGLAGYPSIAPYTASKGAMNALTRSVALEYAKKKVRINSICPSAVNTPLLEEYINAAPDPAAMRSQLEGEFTSTPHITVRCTAMAITFIYIYIRMVSPTSFLLCG